MPVEVMYSIEEVEAALDAERKANVLAQGLAIAQGQGSPEGAAKLGEGIAGMSMSPAASAA